MDYKLHLQKYFNNIFRLEEVRTLTFFNNLYSDMSTYFDYKDYKQKYIPYLSFQGREQISYGGINITIYTLFLFTKIDNVSKGSVTFNISAGTSEFPFGIVKSYVENKLAQEPLFIKYKNAKSQLSSRNGSSFYINFDFDNFKDLDIDFLYFALLDQINDLLGDEITLSESEYKKLYPMLKTGFYNDRCDIITDIANLLVSYNKEKETILITEDLLELIELEYGI
jgi:hypothetical protein